MTIELQRAVSDAVNLVNSHSGQTCIRLRFNDESSALEFMANSAQLRGAQFQFTAGFETFGGNVEELADITAHLIGR